MFWWPGVSSALFTSTRPLPVHPRCVLCGWPPLEPGSTQWPRRSSLLQPQLPWASHYGPAGPACRVVKLCAWNGLSSLPSELALMFMSSWSSKHTQEGISHTSALSGWTIISPVCWWVSRQSTLCPKFSFEGRASLPPEGLLSCTCCSRLPRIGSVDGGVYSLTMGPERKYEGGFLRNVFLPDKKRHMRRKCPPCSFF